jgi:hypothetical protein
MQQEQQDRHSQTADSLILKHDQQHHPQTCSCPLFNDSPQETSKSIHGTAPRTADSGGLQQMLTELMQKLNQRHNRYRWLGGRI